MKPMNFRWLTGAFALLFSVSCATEHTQVADELPALAPLLGENYIAGSAAPGEDATVWWTRFEDPVLDDLVERVLEHNLDLRVAAASVREAEALLSSATGSRGPTIDAQLGASRGFANVDPAGRVYDTSLRPSLRVAWQADLFGRLASVERAAAASLVAAESDRLALTHSLISAAVRLRAAESVARDRLDLADEVIESRSDTLRTVERRYERGLQSASALDVRLARENLASAESARPQLELELARTRHALDELLGRKPGSAPVTGDRADAIPTLAAPPLGLPADLLDRRPDLVAAAFRAEAAAADVDARVAARFPDLFLSASAGWDGDALEDLFDAQTLFANLAADLVAPLFASGRLDADIDAARARLEAGAASYAAQVLGAVREVEDAWISERLLRERLIAVEARLTEARIAEGLARDRYGRGLENLLTVLETERRRAGAEDLALLLHEAVWNARTDLHLALGGDWLAPQTTKPVTTQ